MDKLAATFPSERRSHFDQRNGKLILFNKRFRPAQRDAGPGFPDQPKQTAKLFWPISVQPCVFGNSSSEICQNQHVSMPQKEPGTRHVLELKTHIHVHTLLSTFT